MCTHAHTEHLIPRFTLSRVGVQIFPAWHGCSDTRLQAQECLFSPIFLRLSHSLTGVTGTCLRTTPPLFSLSCPNRKRPGGPGQDWPLQLSLCELIGGLNAGRVSVNLGSIKDLENTCYPRRRISGCKLLQLGYFSVEMVALHKQMCLKI